MRRSRLICSMILLGGLATGCRNPLLSSYANVVDDINDTHLYLDNFYNPRFDISRAGKPDWAGPVISGMYPGICYLGTWKRYTTTRTSIRHQKSLHTSQLCDASTEGQAAAETGRRSGFTRRAA